MRASIRSEIASIEPCDALEAQHRSSALTWVDSEVELCRLAKPATPPMHLVSYFVVVDEACVLLVDHRDAGLWLPTGGHVEAGEHPRAAVLREIEEELGFVPGHPLTGPLIITVSTTVGITAGHTDVSLWYVVEASRSQPIVFDESEFVDVRWFGFDAIPFERADPHLRRFVTKLRGARLSARST